MESNSGCPPCDEQKETVVDACAMEAMQQTRKKDFDVSKSFLGVWLLDLGSNQGPTD
jgi:hypothetical protein